MSEIKIDNIAYTLKNENACVAQEFLCIEQTTDYCVLRVKMSFDAPTVPTSLTVRWLQPMIGFFAASGSPLASSPATSAPTGQKEAPRRAPPLTRRCSRCLAIIKKIR